MELWQILTASSIIPIVMVIVGFCFMRGRPKKVNWWAGYRTSMACKNQDTWVFAHRYIGKLWIPLGFVLVILSIGATIFVERSTPTLLVWIPIVQLAILLITIISTEIALRKEFDKNGERRR